MHQRAQMGFKTPVIGKYDGGEIEQYGGGEVDADCPHYAEGELEQIGHCFNTAACKGNIGGLDGNAAPCAAHRNSRKRRFQRRLHSCQQAGIHQALSTGR